MCFGAKFVERKNDSIARFAPLKTAFPKINVEKIQNFKDRTNNQIFVKTFSYVLASNRGEKTVPNKNLLVFISTPRIP